MGEYAPYNIWFIMFMGAQGYAIKNNVIYQGNQSAIHMDKNGWNSCTGNSRHIHIRYFFVKDRIDKGEMWVERYPTHLMLAHFFNKPLMGELFGKLRSIIMGYTSIFELDLTLLQSIKEHVGIWVGTWLNVKAIKTYISSLFCRSRAYKVIIERIFVILTRDKNQTKTNETKVSLN